MEEEIEKRQITHDLFGAPIRPDTINSKRKGNDNEYHCSKLLTKWTGEKFTKVPRSGGARWVNTVNVCGDVVCENQDFAFIFSVETKFYKKVAFPVKIKENSLVAKFFRQATDDAIRARKLPLLVVRENDMPKGTWMVYFPFPIPGHASISSGPVNGQMIYGYLSTYMLEHIKYSDVVTIVNEQYFVSLNK